MSYKPIVLALLLAALSGCAPGMGSAYSTLPHTFNDLGAQSRAVRNGQDAPAEASVPERTNAAAGASAMAAVPDLDPADGAMINRDEPATQP